MLPPVFGVTDERETAILNSITLKTLAVSRRNNPAGMGELAVVVGKIHLIILLQGSS